MSEWRTVRLGDEADLITGYPFKSESYSDDISQPRLLRGDNIAQGWLRWDGAKRWSTAATAGLDAYWLRKGDVVLAMDRPWIDAGLKFASVHDSDLPSLLVQRVCRIRGTASLDTDFLRYVIGGRDFTNHVLAVQTGTAVPHISRRQIEEFEFLAPDIHTQKSIARILSNLDNKIELNRRMSTTLESIARAIFQSWFVDFDPVRAKADGEDAESVRQRLGLTQEWLALFPDGFENSVLGQLPRQWQPSTIGTLADVVGGSTPNTKEPTFWEDGTNYWATPKDLSRQSTPVLLGTERKVTDSGLAQIGSGLLPPGTVLMSSRAPIGYRAINEIPVAINQGFIAMKPKPGISGYFLLYWTEWAHQEIVSRANGSTFLEISKSSFRQIPVARPPEEILSAFNQVVHPIYQRMVSNERENLVLAEQRANLLAELLSGRFAVEAEEES